MSASYGVVAPKCNNYHYVLLISILYIYSGNMNNLNNVFEPFPPTSSTRPKKREENYARPHPPTRFPRPRNATPIQRARPSNSASSHPRNPPCILHLPLRQHLSISTPLHVSVPCYVPAPSPPNKSQLERACGEHAAVVFYQFGGIVGDFCG